MALSKVGKNQVDQSASLTVDGDLTVDTNALYVDSTNNRVGIGASSPSAKLSVNDANGIPIHMGDISAAPTSQTAAYVGVSTSSLTGGNGDLVLAPRTSDARSILFYTGNGTAAERLRIDSSGRVTMPYQVGFSAFKVSPFSTTSTGQYVTYTNVDHNVGNHYNSSTGIFTCPIAGRYLVLHSHLTYSNGSGFAIAKNSSFVRQSYVGGGNWQQPAMSTVLNCAANDTIRIYADNNTYLHDNQYGMFSVHLMA